MIKKIFTVLLFLFSYYNTFGQFPGNDNTPGTTKTFNVPANVTSVTATVWGAGGGGGGSNSNNSGGNGGGGGGASSRTINVTGGTTTFTYTVGQGGSSGASNGGTGGNGALSSISSTSPLINMLANGGKGGRGNAAGLNTPTNSAGGTSSGGTINSTGLVGTQGGTSGGGNGGDSGTVNTIFGLGGFGNSGASGSPGNIPGGGGGGGERGGGSDYAGGAGANGQITFQYIGVTNITPNPACIGSTITITGFNFSNGTNTVIINGTSCTSVTWVNSTTITAVVGAGTTSGTVIVTNPNGTNNGRTLTVNSSPAAIAGGSATVCIGATTPAFTNSTAGGTWSIINGTGAATVSTSGVVTGVTAGNVTVAYTLPNSCAVTTSLTVISTPTITSNPINSTINSGNNTSFTVVANNTPTSYTWEVSTNGGSTWTTVTNGGVYSTATTATLNITAATALMSGYRYRARANNSCGSSANSTAAILTVNLIYCTPSTTTTNSALYISQVNFVGTLNDVTNNSTYPGTGAFGYQDFTGLSSKATQAQGEAVNLVVEGDGTRVRGTWKAWVDWNKNGVFTDAGEEVYNIYGFVGKNITFGFQIPSGATPGDYRIRIRVNNGTTSGSENYGFNFNSCENFGSSGATIYYGEAEDYLFTVISSCSANIATVTNGNNCGPGTVNLTVTGTPGTTQYKWYANKVGGTALATTTSGNWTTPSISTTTIYWVTALNGSCESVNRTKITARISPIPTLSFTLSDPDICGENTVLSLTAAGDTEVAYLIDENFETGGLGVFSNINNDTNSAAVKNNTQWQNRTSVFIPSSNVWFPAISSGFGANKFALAYSDSNPYPSSNIENSLTLSSAVNSNTFTDLTLSLDLYYSRYHIDNTNNTSEYVALEVSTDGGATYPTILQTLTSDIGIGSNFSTLTFDMSAFINRPNLKIRIKHRSNAGAGWLPDGVAIDNVQLYGTKPLSTSLNWSGASLPDVFLDAACTIPFPTGSAATTVYVRPTLAQLETGSFTFTTTATLSNGCSASKDITINNNSKIWKGSVNGNWNNPNNWSPVGVPDANTCVIIPSSTNFSNINGTNYNAYGKTLQVKDTGNLQVQSGNSLTITDYVNVTTGGIFNLENNASLIQINNTINTGIITSKRNAYIRTLDYVYWSSPVANFSSSAISPSTSTSYIYKWLPTISGNVNGHGNWANGNEIMVKGKGYIVRGPNIAPYNTGISTFTASFKGVPNNGNISTNISRGTYNGIDYNTTQSTTFATKDDDNWNLIGNPYPSALNANLFLATNTNIAGYINRWTHGTLPNTTASDPFYANYSNNYSTSDYITYNITGANPPIGDGNIASGQGFFVLMNHTAGANETVQFNNSMRRNDYRNDVFFRGSNENVLEPEKHRIWLNLINPSNKSTSTLLGYIEGATNEVDRLYDVPALQVKTDFEIYSINNLDKLSIQGRSNSFSVNDEIPIGVKTNQNGIQTIAINKVDGLFSDATQNIYLEDKNLNIIHDLRAAPYTFTSNVGIQDNRFILRFTNAKLSNNNFEIENSIVILTNDVMSVNSPIEEINKIEVFDMLGKTIKTYRDINSNNLTLNGLIKNNNALILKITLNNGAIVNRKILF